MNNLKQIKFSIIMPFFNSAFYIENAVKSVLNQTYQNFEFIAVNDGSKDNSAEIVKELFKGQQNKLVLLEKENGGYVSAVNFGLDNISGDYFMFIGSDDQLDLNILQKVVDNIENELPDIVGFNTLKVWPDKQEIEEYTRIEKKTVSSNTNVADFSNEYKKESRIFSLRDTSKIYKSSLLGDLRYFGKSGYDADGIFTMLFARKCSSYMCLPEIGYHWTLRKDSLSGKKPSEQVNIDRVQNWLKFYYNIASCKNFSMYEINYFSYVLCLLIDTVVQGKELLKYHKQDFKKLSKLLIRFNKNNRFLNWKSELFLKHPKVYLLLRKVKH